MATRTRPRVVVDGSNLATEGRTLPSLAQLDDALAAFIDENPTAEIIVVTDASFSHRVEVSERSRFKELEMAGRIVTPPAGAIGRGDAFILKIADRINAVVLSNDSFQEFHDEYPWLFDVGRLIGGKPVPMVGWVFTPRLPVRNVKKPRAVKKLAVELPGGVQPTIGTTLTPVKKATKRAAKAPAKVAKKATKALKADKAEKAPEKAIAAKATAARAPAEKAPVEKVLVDKTGRAKKAPSRPAKRTAKVVPGERGGPALPVDAQESLEKPPTTPVLRRGRQPVNPEASFAQFRAAHKVGTRVEGEVSAFTSHGAVIRVATKGGGLVECYAPTTLLGSPAPARARDVLSRGDRVSFRLVTVDDERRIAELSLL
ncbi:MAG: NYN domain-containing protein [Acidimicrobiales bacterium]